MEKYVLTNITERLGVKIQSFQVKNPLELNEKDLSFFTLCFSEIPHIGFLNPHYHDISLCLILDRDSINIFLQGNLNIEMIKSNFENLFEAFAERIPSHSFFNYEVFPSANRKTNFHLSLTCSAIKK